MAIICIIFAFLYLHNLFLFFVDIKSNEDREKKVKTEEEEERLVALYKWNDKKKKLWEPGSGTDIVKFIIPD